MKNLILISLICCSAVPFTAECQPTVFTVLQDPLKLGDRNFMEGNYTAAIGFYQNSLSRNPGDTRTQLKLARSYYHIKNYEKSVSVYNSAMAKKDVLPKQDLYYYAEAQLALLNRKVALEYYKRFLELEPDNDLVAKKIWRLNNINYLYEDSAHYSIRPVAINTTFGELCAVPFRNSIVFTSNRKRVSLVDEVNGKQNAPFYQLYTAPLGEDSIRNGDLIVGAVTHFASSIKSRFNVGPVAFFNNNSKMVYVSTSEKDGGENRTLGLYFASFEDNRWSEVIPFPYNSDEYSIGDVTINEEGTRLYFSSDMKGGIGGKDIYTSQWVNGKWTKPKNAGDVINTPQNEVFPYLYKNTTLYFSSNGHAGIGELDIFKAQVKADGYGEPENVGYPLNSGRDDFGLTFDSLGAHGYLTSNRMNGGYDDDVYEFDMDLQVYPFSITGVVKYKEHTWSDESAILPWSDAKVLLVDSRVGVSIAEATTDGDGRFSLTIPYFSKYYLQVNDRDGKEYKASLEILKHARDTYEHEIVLVKDIFDSNGNQK